MNQDAFAKEFYFAELGRRADEAMAAKVSAGLPSGRIPLGYLMSVTKTGIEPDIEKAVKSREKVGQFNGAKVGHKRRSSRLRFPAALDSGSA
jgi:hypothetical protein